MGKIINYNIKIMFNHNYNLEVVYIIKILYKIKNKYIKKNFKQKIRIFIIYNII